MQEHRRWLRESFSTQHRGHRGSRIGEGWVEEVVRERLYLCLVYAFGSASYRTLSKNILVDGLVEILVMQEPARFHVRSSHWREDLDVVMGRVCCSQSLSRDV